MAKKKAAVAPAEKPITQVLLESIDELGRVRATRLTAEKREEELKKLVKDAMPEGKIVYATQFAARLNQETKTIIDVAAVYKKLGLKKFMEIASLTLKALATKLDPAEIEKVTSQGKGALKIDVFPAVPDMAGQTVAIPEDETTNPVVRTTI